LQPVATCCLFLAGKAEETPKKCRDIIRTMRQLTNDRQFETFGVDPREEIMALERVLLQVCHHIFSISVCVSFFK
jgi:Cyclin, N-terminal domain